MLLSCTEVLHYPFIVKRMKAYYDVRYRVPAAAYLEGYEHSADSRVFFNTQTQSCLWVFVARRL